MNLGATAKRANQSEKDVSDAVALGASTFILVPTTIAVILLLVAIFSPEDRVGHPLVVLLIAVSWPLALYGLYRMAGHQRPVQAALGTWIAGAVLFSLEIVWGVYTLFTFGEGYFALAAIATFIGVMVSKALTRG
jgi:hypothetical protein